MIELKDAGRGFFRGEFRDLNGCQCSIQESSSALQDCLWLGREHDLFNNRMHLTRGMAAELAGLLAGFAATGSLRWPDEPGMGQALARVAEAARALRDAAEEEGRRCTRP